MDVSHGSLRSGRVRLLAVSFLVVLIAPMRYTKDYAIPYALKSGDPNHVPRAVYAVYNAGLRAVGRFAKNPPHPREQRVDEHLWELYQGISSGAQADLRSCSVGSVTAAQ